nr:uncharacterized protein LOC102118608 isoform X2 [Macaca fascicularis]
MTMLGKTEFQSYRSFSSVLRSGDTEKGDTAPGLLCLQNDEQSEGSRAAQCRARPWEGERSGREAPAGALLNVHLTAYNLQQMSMAAGCADSGGGSTWLQLIAQPIGFSVPQVSSSVKWR